MKPGHCQWNSLQARKESSQRTGIENKPRKHILNVFLYSNRRKEGPATTGSPDLENTWLRLVLSIGSEHRFRAGLPSSPPGPLLQAPALEMSHHAGPKIKLRAFFVAVVLTYHRSTIKTQLSLVELSWNISHKEGGVKDQAAVFCSGLIHPPTSSHTQSIET